ncbi:MAG TPA: aminotransferase class I/II-fold pyridoxal phosphate-dependent enzyme [Bacteroidales bacterium]|nr:aminotransferase class I/II-fold pyridoxal phosphate-dependent enzyme [Bacteroidales bacterium]
MVILEGEIGNFIVSGNRKYSYFAGNNYLGLATHPLVKEAAVKAVEQFGTGFSASRQTTGTSLLHLELEKELSEFKQQDDSVIFASGFLGNRILMEVLRNKYSSVFIDQGAHPSTIYAIPGDVNHIYGYSHCDPADLEAKLEENAAGIPIIITDGVFALTGEIAPLDRIYDLALRYKGMLIVDDAHSTGILGENGRGTPEYFGIEGAKGIWQSETMSKALGSYGGFISSDPDIVSQIRDSSVIYRASTALPPPVVAAGIASLRIIRENPGIRTELAAKAGFLRKGIISLGFHSSEGITPIIPVFEDYPGEARNLSAFLEQNGIIVPAINYPGMGSNLMLRITVSVLHEYEQIEMLLENLRNWKNRNEKTSRSEVPQGG